MFDADLPTHRDALGSNPGFDLGFALIKSDVLPGSVRRCRDCQRMQLAIHQCRIETRKIQHPVQQSIQWRVVEQ